MAESSQRNAIALLKVDHRKVEDLFEQFEKASGDGRKEKLAKEICLQLTVHMTIEEELFYPACEGKVDEDKLKEGLVEHDSAKLLMAEIEAASGAGDEFFATKVHVLQEEVEHHVKEEEKRGEGIFALARGAEIDLDTLGQRMEERKQALLAAYQDGGLPKPNLATMEEVAI